MEQTHKKRFSVIAVAIAMAASVANAQYVEFDEDYEDKDVRKHIQSMEDQNWDFGKGLFNGMFFGLLHRSYSGFSGWKIWDPKYVYVKSNIGWAMLHRVGQTAELGLLIKPDVNKHKEAMEEICKEEAILAADRNVDLAIVVYKDDFKSLTDNIKRALTECLLVSNGALLPRVEMYYEKFDVLCESISYIRKTGPEYELENANRQDAYEDLLGQLRKLNREISRYTKAAIAAYK